MLRSLNSSVKTVVLNTGTAAGTGNVNLTAVDTLGFTGLRICVLLGALTATQVTALKAQQSLDNAGTDPYADAPGAVTGNAADADGGKLLILEIYRPHKRYIKGIVTRATANAAITSAWAELFNASAEPVAADSTVSQQITVLNPH